MKNILSAFRTLFRFKLYTAINMVGLVLSVAATLVIMRYVHQELTVDHFCKNLDRTYVLTIDNREHIRIMEHLDRNKDPNYVSPVNNPEVEVYSFCVSLNDDFIKVGDLRYKANVLVTDSMFTEIMDYPIVTGITSIRQPDDAIITRRYAQKIFGKENPLGRQITTSADKVLTVRGIIDEPSTKASLQFDLIASAFQEEDAHLSWTRVGFTLVRLVKGCDMNKYNEKISKPMTLLTFNNTPIQFRLFPLEKLYFDKTVDSSAASFLRGNYDHILILSAVACMLLLVGIFNFINIYTVIMLKRAREFGIKKVYGATSSQIFFQIYSENVCTSAIALLFIWMLIELSGGLFATIYNIPVKADWMFDLTLSVFILFGLPLIISLYPFLRYNYSSPVTSLRSINVSGHSIVSRMLFLFIQYVITFCLIVISIYFVWQLHTMLHTDLGYKTKDIIITKVVEKAYLEKVYKSDEEWERHRDEELHQQQVIKQKMDESPLFSSWQYGEPLVALDENTTITGEDGEKHKVVFLYSNKEYMDMFGMQLKEGRTWNDTDHFSQYKMIINESAQKLFHIKDIHKASLQTESRLWWGQGEDLSKNPPFQVVGVIKDFRFGHLSKGNLPLVILYQENGGYMDPMIAQIVPGKRKEAICFLQSLHEELEGKGYFEYTFIEDEIAKLYDADKRMTQIYVTFAGLAIFISCLGLLGLSLYDIRQRYREIALRKVNGASGKQIALLLLRKYLYILGASFLVSIPLSYYIINDYTKDFVVKAPIGIGIFLISLIVTLAISLGTLLWQVRKAVRLNPGIIMKNE